MLSRKSEAYFQRHHNLPLNEKMGAMCPHFFVKTWCITFPGESESLLQKGD